MLKMIEITMSSANEPSNWENNIKIKILLNAFSLNHSPSLLHAYSSIIECFVNKKHDYLDLNESCGNSGQKCELMGILIRQNGRLNMSLSLFILPITRERRLQRCECYV